MWIYKPSVGLAAIISDIIKTEKRTYINAAIPDVQTLLSDLLSNNRPNIWYLLSCESYRNLFDPLDLLVFSSELVFTYTFLPNERDVVYVETGECVIQLLLLSTTAPPTATLKPPRREYRIAHRHIISAFHNSTSPLNLSPLNHR
jgi:hypothetical protein